MSRYLRGDDAVYDIPNRPHKAPTSNLTLNFMSNSSDNKKTLFLAHKGNQPAPQSQLVVRDDLSISHMEQITT